MHHTQTIVPVSNNDKHDQQVLEHHEPALQTGDAVQDTNITELQHDPEAEHQKHTVEHNEEALGHPKPAFDEHQDTASRFPDTSDGQTSPTRNEVQIHQESEQSIESGKFS